MKKGGLFGKIVYYVFTFLIGILIALGLPYYFYNLTAPYEFIDRSLSEGDYASAVVLISNYFNKQIAYEHQFESGGGIVLFEGVVSVQSNSQEPDPLNGTLYKTYIGFVYGTEGAYNVYGTGNNRTKLVVTDVNGNQIDVELLDFDADGDEINDGIATQTQNDFIILDIDANAVPSIGKLALIDKDGNEFWSSQALNLTFDGDFFVKVDGYIGEYNALIQSFYDATTDEQRQTVNEQLEETFTSFNKQFATYPNYGYLAADSEDYLKVDKELNKISNRKSIPAIVIYFVCVYVIGDFLLGTHYIIKGVRWILVKVFKVKLKSKDKVSRSEVFGHDYYSSVTVSLDLDAVPDFSESVQIKYTNTDAEVVFILLKENGYTATERIKAGTYVNPFIDINREYAPVDLPENLVVEGYRMDVKIKIIKREV